MAKTAKKGKIYVIFGHKGGIGKSLIAAHLGVCIMGRGRKLQVVDLDPRQGDSVAFFRGRKSEEEIVVHTPETLEELEALFHDVPASGCDLVVDCSPGDNALSLHACEFADVLVMPFKPGANDARALGRALRIASAGSKKGRVMMSLVNFHQPTTRDSKALVSLLQTTDFFVFAGAIGQRTLFNEAIRTHRATWEVSPESAAAEEVLAACSSIMEAAE